MGLSAWVLASRPKTLLAALVPVLVGSAIAWRDGAFDPLRALVVVAGSVLIQVGTNFYNDYADFGLGADTAARKGPTRAVAAGLIAPRAMWWAAVLVFALALGCSGVLAMWAGWPMLLIGVVSVACGFWYTAGRWSIAYLGLGEVFVVLFFGLVATGGTYYAMAEALPWYAWVSGLCPGLLATGLIAVNNWRDIEEDRAVAKRTMAVRLGAGFAAAEYVVCVVGGALVPGGVFAGLAGAPVWTRGLFALPALVALLLWARGWRPGLRGRELLPFLGLTAVVMLAVGVVFAVAWGMV